MKNRAKITTAYLDSLPPEYTDGIDAVLREAEVEPYLMRRGFEGLSIAEDEERCSVAVMSTRDIDADNEIILPWGLDLERYQRNPLLLWGHKWSEPPIGSCSQLQVDDYCMRGKFNFARTPRAEEIWSLVRDKHLRTNSIGFFVLDYVSRGHKDFGPMIDRAMKEWDEFDVRMADKIKGFVRRGMLVENSVVTVPSNANAIMQAVAAKQIELAQDTLKRLGLDPESCAADEDPSTEETQVIEVAAEAAPAEAAAEAPAPQAPEEVPADPAQAVEEPLEAAIPAEAKHEPYHRLIARAVDRSYDRLVKDAIDLRMGKV